MYFVLIAGQSTRPVDSDVYYTDVLLADLMRVKKVGVNEEEGNIKVFYDKFVSLDKETSNYDPAFFGLTDV